MRPGIILLVMQVKDLSEFDLIELLAESIGASGAPRAGRPSDLGFRLRVPIGDDAAAWDGPSGSRTLTTDALVEGVHFDLGHTGWSDLGWKTLAVNLSDVAAMGCAPLYSVITLGLRGDLPVDGLVEMYRGMSKAAREYGGDIVGGDVVRSPVFFVAVAMVGTVPSSDANEGREQPLLTRGAARPGDKIAVTGSLGCSGGGLRMYADELGFNGETSAHLANAHNRPEPRVAEGVLLAQHRVAAAIDVSDGLVDDLRKVCEASGAGALVHADRVPADEFLRRAYPDEWLSLALSGGEDYELLFTAPPQVIDETASLLDVPVSVIGEIVDQAQGVTVLDEDGSVIQVPQGGWDHFRQTIKGGRRGD